MSNIFHSEVVESCALPSARQYAANFGSVANIKSNIVVTELKPFFTNAAACDWTRLRASSILTKYLPKTHAKYIFFYVFEMYFFQ
jgi:hypothetical protein